MQISIDIEVSEEEFRKCIASGWNKRHREDLHREDFQLQPSGDVGLSDIKNITAGSSLGELINEDNTTMVRTE